MDEDLELETTEATEDQEVAEESASFAASFNDDVRVDETPTEPVEEAEPAEAQAEAPEPSAEVAGVTQEQLTAMLAKLPKIDEVENMTASEMRKVYGKLGEFNRTLQELQKASAEHKPSVKLTSTSFKRLSEEYPEIAEILAADFNDSGVSGGSNDVSQLEPLVTQRVAQVQDQLQKEMQTNLLTIQHRDYLSVVQSDDFKVWMQTIPAEDQEKIGNTWDAMYLGEKISSFKEWRDKKTESSMNRKQRLERAITPKGLQQKAQQAALSEQDGFMAAFR
jgi:hypothetical protein